MDNSDLVRGIDMCC